MCAGSSLFFSLGAVSPDEQRGVAAEIFQVGHGRRRGFKAPPQRAQNSSTEL